MKVNKQICKKCQQELGFKRSYQKKPLVLSGYCGKSITIKENGIQIFSDDADCPKCPTFVEPVEYAERSLKRIKGEEK